MRMMRMMMLRMMTTRCLDDSKKRVSLVRQLLNLDRLAERG